MTGGGQRRLCTDVELDTPYPPIRVEAPNLDYAISLFKSYAGYDSELTASTQYLYQTAILFPDDPVSADLLECIGFVEMGHFHVLGRIIYLLGADPRVYAPASQFGASRRARVEGTVPEPETKNGYTWWSGDMLIYTNEYITLIQDNLQLEKITIANFNAAIREIDDIYIRAMLERIILDERRHVEIFQSMLDAAQSGT